MGRTTSASTSMVLEHRYFGINRKGIALRALTIGLVAIARGLRGRAQHSRGFIFGVLTIPGSVTLLLLHATALRANNSLQLFRQYISAGTLRLRIFLVVIV